MSTSRKRRQPRIAALVLVTQTFLFAPTARATEKPEQLGVWEWSGVPRVVAVGDLHGNHDKLVQLLTAAELVDGELSWSGGGSHLVVAGDFLDRGEDDRPLMDLLRRLEEESIAGGGRVHVLLGNHEVMNLFRDTRYVSPSAYQHFAREESKADRKTAVGKFATLEGGDWTVNRFREFNKRYPRGFFARQKSFNPDGEYGSWLLRLPAIVKINGVAYLHGGLSEEFAALGVDGINRRITDEARRLLESRQALEQEGVVSEAMDYSQIIAAAQRVLDLKRGSQKRRQTAHAFLAASTHPILGGPGPLWYRGNALQDERLERDTITSSLELIGATAMVVAHSPTTSRRITSRFHGRLFRIDHDINGSKAPLALVAEQGEILVLDSATLKKTEPFRELPLGQVASSRTPELPDQDLDSFLSDSLVIATRNLGRGSTRPQLIVLERAGEIRRGIFKTVESDTGADRYQHEVAAYRLDRAIGLGMVPVAVLRTLSDRAGSLQAWIDGAIDQEAAQAYELEFCTNDAADAQLALGRIFDSLIGNTGRKLDDILCHVRDEKVLLIDHSKAFSTSSDLAESSGETLSVPASLAEALRSLNREALGLQLGDLLSDAQVDALLQRRNKLLDRLEIVATSR